MWTGLEGDNGTVEHRSDEGDEVQPRRRLGQPLVVLGRRLKRVAHAKLLSTTHRRGKSTKLLLAPGSTTSSLMPSASTAAAGPSSV